MSKRLNDLLLMEICLLDVKDKMECLFNTMKSIDVEGMNKDIKSCTKEELDKMNEINELLERVDRYWNKTIL
ncbi:hypothetical protein [uncultured Clostridium sp.]|uniref:hypothetical protein n=1 Tax=uncultured Clostridium sp. TaxID=59620 RepID=UPI003216B7FE